MEQLDARIEVTEHKMESVTTLAAIQGLACLRTEWLGKQTSLVVRRRRHGGSTCISCHGLAQC